MEHIYQLLKKSNMHFISPITASEIELQNSLNDQKIVVELP